MRRALRFSPRFHAILLPVLLILPVAYFTALYSVPIYGVYYYPERVRSHWVLAALAVAWLGWKAFRKQEVPHTSLDLPVAAILVAVGLSTLTSTDPRISAEGGLGTFAYGLSFYFLLDLVRHPRLRTSLVDAVLLVTVMVCGLALLQVWTWYQGLPAPLRSALWRSLGRALPLPRLSMLENPNILAAYLVLTLPLGAYRWGRLRSRLARLLVGVGLLAGVVVLLLARSRGGVLGLGAAVLFGLWLTHRRSPVRQRIAFLLVFLLVVIAGGMVLAQRGLRLTEGSGLVRLESWRVALLVLRDHPLLGSGPATFGRQLLRYRDPTRLQEVHAHAHNMVLTFGAETGLVGLLAAAWLAVAFVGALRRRSSPASGFTLNRACLAGLAGWAVHSLVDSFLDKPTILLHALLLAALLLVQREAVSFRRNLPRLVAIALLAALLLGAAAWIDWGHGAFYVARTAARMGDWEKAARWLDEAVERDPQHWFYRRERAFAYGVLACADPQRLSQAIAAYEAHLQNVEEWAPDHVNLAVLRAQAGDAVGAVWAMGRARELAPGQPLYGCLLGRYEEAALLADAALRYDPLSAYADCLARSPELLSSSFWAETPWRVEHRLQIVRRAEEIVASEGNVTAWAALRAAAGDPELSLIHI